jgi:phosphatidylserine decarboxylase
MSFLDVHVNRAPLEGTVCFHKKINGLFLSLKNKEALLQNERALTVIESSGYRVGVVQIASRLVRNIVNYIEHGQEVVAGQRIGMIRFGSQVDIVLPDHPFLEIHVIQGQRVKAGLSVLADMQGGEQSRG